VSSDRCRLPSKHPFSLVSVNVPSSSWGGVNTYGQFQRAGTRLFSSRIAASIFWP
jgi:hypothetical protein